MDFLIGLIYGGRGRELNAVVNGITENTDQDHKLVLGLNAIDEYTCAFLMDKSCEFVWRRRNMGHFPMANLIAEKACGLGAKFFVDVNDDVYVIKKDWLKRIAEEFEKDPLTRLVTFRECIPNPQDAMPNGYAKEFASACFAARTDYILENGLFDPRFFWYSGDSDLGWSCWENGYRIRWIEEGWINHTFRCGRDLRLPEKNFLAKTDSERLSEKWKNTYGKRRAEEFFRGEAGET
jgi:hypothetical protein